MGLFGQGSGAAPEERGAAVCATRLTSGSRPLLLPPDAVRQALCGRISGAGRGGEKGDEGGRGEEKGDVGGQDLFKGSAFRPSLWSSSEVHRKPFVMPGEISIAVLSRGARGLVKPWVEGGEEGGGLK